MQILEDLFLSKKPFTIEYKGQQFSAKACVKLTSLTMYPDIYYKVKFEDSDAGMFYIPSTNDLYFSLGKVDTSNISDEDLGEDKLDFQDEEYHLEFNDHQIVVEIIFGSPLDAEGECRFFDYYNSDNSKNLSLGWIFRGEGKDVMERADVYSEKVELTDIKIS